MGESLSSLSGKSVGFAGRLLTCDRRAAARLVLDVGARIAPARAAEVLVVGHGSRHPRTGASRTLTEAQFLEIVRLEASAGSSPKAPGLAELVPGSEVARLYPRLTWSRRRSLARHGLLRPVALPNGIGYRFGDLRVLRAIDEMIATGLSLQQSITRIGPRLRGQLEFRFPEARIAPRPLRADLGGLPKTAEAWFDVGACADRDRSGFPAAIAAYRRALEADPRHVPSLINLGNIHYELGEFAPARDLYTRAADVDAENPRTHFNLGNACDELGDLLGALRAYRSAIHLWPGYADAHFNLALVAEKLDSWSLACRHWRRFLDLEPRSNWAAVASSHLEDAQAKQRGEKLRGSAGLPSRPGRTS